MGHLTVNFRKTVNGLSVALMVRCEPFASLEPRGRGGMAESGRNGRIGASVTPPFPPRRGEGDIEC
jgi:hypothetical protein